MAFVRMRSHLPLFFVFLLVIPFFCAGAEPFNTYCGDNGGKVMTEKLSSIIDRILKLIIPGASDPDVGGYAHFTVDEGGDFMSSMAQCRRDVSHEDCVACLRDADQQIRDLCPDKVDVRIWFEHCFVRYDSDDFLGKVDTDVAFEGPDDLAEVPDPDAFTVALDALLNDVQEQAMRPESKGLGKATTQFTPSLTLYVLFQCTEDLSAESCGKCMSTSKQTFRDICLHKKACTVAYSSCYVRYAFDPF